jgi:hypothetical protein
LLAQTYAKYLTLLPRCVTLSSNVFRPKIGLANLAFAVQHLSRDKVVTLEAEKTYIFHDFVAEFEMDALSLVRLPG